MKTNALLHWGDRLHYFTSIKIKVFVAWSSSCRHKNLTSDDITWQQKIDCYKIIFFVFFLNLYFREYFTTQLVLNIISQLKSRMKYEDLNYPESKTKLKAFIFSLTI